MITINIDRTCANKKVIEDYLVNIIQEIQKGETIGEDWEMHGDEQDADIPQNPIEPDDFTGSTSGDR